MAERPSATAQKQHVEQLETSLRARLQQLQQKLLDSSANNGTTAGSNAATDAPERGPSPPPAISGAERAKLRHEARSQQPTPAATTAAQEPAAQQAAPSTSPSPAKPRKASASLPSPPPPAAPRAQPSDAPGASRGLPAALPGPGGWYEYQGQRVQVPVWPDDLALDSQQCSKTMCAMLDHALNSLASCAMPPYRGKKYRSLTDMGKECLLQTRARIQLLSVTDKVQYSEVLSRSPWLESPEWAGYMWGKLRTRWEKRVKTKKGTDAGPGRQSHAAEVEAGPQIETVWLLDSDEENVFDEACWDTDTEDAAARIPKPKAWFKFAGEQVRVPERWPREPRATDEVPHPRLQRLIDDILGPDPLHRRESPHTHTHNANGKHGRDGGSNGGGGKQGGGGGGNGSVNVGRYLYAVKVIGLPLRRGLASMGKRVLLEVMAKVDELKTLEPDSHREILNRHKWIADKTAEWAPYLWTLVHRRVDVLRSRNTKKHRVDESSSESEEEEQESGEQPSDNEDTPTQPHTAPTDTNTHKPATHWEPKKGLHANATTKAPRKRTTSPTTQPQQQEQRYPQHMQRKEKSGGNEVQEGTGKGRGVEVPVPQALPAGGSAYVFAGRSVCVPERWPSVPYHTKEPYEPELRGVVLSVLHPDTTLVPKHGSSDSPVSITQGQGQELTEYGKGTMLRVMACVQHLRAHDVPRYEKILEQHPWLTSEHPTWIARLWSKVEAIISATDKKGGLSSVPGIGKALLEQQRSASAPAAQPQQPQQQQPQQPQPLPQQQPAKAAHSRESSAFRASPLANGAASSGRPRAAAAGAAGPRSPLSAPPAAKRARGGSEGAEVVHIDLSDDEPAHHSAHHAAHLPTSPGHHHINPSACPQPNHVHSPPMQPPPQQPIHHQPQQQYAQNGVNPSGHMYSGQYGGAQGGYEGSYGGMHGPQGSGLHGVQAGLHGAQAGLYGPQSQGMHGPQAGLHGPQDAGGPAHYPAHPYVQQHNGHTYAQAAHPQSYAHAQPHTQPQATIQQAYGLQQGPLPPLTRPPPQQQLMHGHGYMGAQGQQQQEQHGAYSHPPGAHGAAAPWQAPYAAHAVQQPQRQPAPAVRPPEPFALRAFAPPPLLPAASQTLPMLATHAAFAAAAQHAMQTARVTLDAMPAAPTPPLAPQDAASGTAVAAVIARAVRAFPASPQMRGWVVQTVIDTLTHPQLTQAVQSSNATLTLRYLQDYTTRATTLRTCVTDGTLSQAMINRVDFCVGELVRCLVSVCEGEQGAGAGMSEVGGCVKGSVSDAVALVTQLLCVRPWR